MMNEDENPTTEVFPRMVFSSLSFLLLFLPAALLIYFLSPRRARNAVLFTSAVFYAG